MPQLNAIEITDEDVVGMLDALIEEVHRLNPDALTGAEKLTTFLIDSFDKHHTPMGVVVLALSMILRYAIARLLKDYLIEKVQ